MARQLLTNVEIDDFIAKVIREANHHAPNVGAVITPLSNAVRARLNLATDKVEVYERNGQLARTCWVTIGGRRYVFTYNYGSGQIDLKAGTLQGAIRSSFDNSTQASTITHQAARL
ncbi:hypothetical protein [Sinorhizobium saheli]|uniref:hypothetical protein n=1 Tax=Sinorhizobium saheli TaxID=36856 RepID=UPI001295EDF3|nr:hypothetical protein [Sinorhizobium saheli]MQW86000.1 hypothetical protein [Sinorhizobium saheli]